MEIKLKTEHSFSKGRFRAREEISIPKLSEKFNNREERPFNSDSSNLSFKGLFYVPVVEKAGDEVAKIFNAKETIALAKKYLGSNFENLYEDLKSNPLAKNLAKNMFNDENGIVTFHKKTFLKLLLDGIIYPVKILPADILNGVFSLLRKVKPLEKWANEVYGSSAFKKIRQRSKIDSKVNSLRGVFETVEKLKGKTDDEISSILFQRSVKMFDEKTGSYDTKHERALNRIVSGMIPAVFLANDAYNLSRMCDDNPKGADKEKKVRFRQEVSRIGFNAYLMLITYGALQKYINNSKAGIMLMTAVTVLFTEAFSRLANGKHIVRLSKAKAQEINKKQGNSDFSAQAPAKEEFQQGYDYKKMLLKSDKKRAVFSSFKGVAQEDKGSAKSEQKAPLLSPKTLFKACLIAISAGFAVKGLRFINLKKLNIKIKDSKGKEKIVKNVGDYLDNVIFKPFKLTYEKLTMNKNNSIARTEFDKIIARLRQQDVGFDELAAKYEKVVAQIDEQALKSNKFSKEYINLGTKKKKTKPFIDFVIAPFKFTYGAIALPYKLTDKLINVVFSPFIEKASVKKIIKLADSQNNFDELDAFVKKFMTGKDKDKFMERISKISLPDEQKELAKNIIKKITEIDLKNEDVKALQKSIDFIGKEALVKDFNPQHFQNYIRDNIAKAFNVDNMSALSNSELSNLAKTSATAATLWFLMADNYNMVMLKSNGEDKEGAKLKSKERFVQEMSRLFYQTLLIDLFNSTFRSQYNSSLFGMSWITTINTTIGEILTRKSVGMPVLPHTRDELIEMDKKKDNATGFAKGYYNFMTRLTGKKSLAEQHQAKQTTKK